MMLHFKKTLGFSLIELMVVMAIMGGLLALTGGLVTKSIDQQQRQVELEKVEQLFKRLSYQAYYSGYNYQLHAQGSQIKVNTDREIYTVDFKQLEFVMTDFIISTKASISPAKYSVIWNGQTRTFPIQPMFKPYE
ncbi:MULTISPECIES: type II secretion system protein [unclassified Pseudoalteromonas]|uniref:type II secretion system protein n=1 Tax=unclassified Pseudoalteromonas TaxID=194690 RepID=UPI0005AA4BCA|nr:MULTISPECIES: type II secretion system protein [unclassified Pseudoalteromonas]